MNRQARFSGILTGALVLCFALAVVLLVICGICRHRKTLAATQ